MAIGSRIMRSNLIPRCLILKPEGVPVSLIEYVLFILYGCCLISIRRSYRSWISGVCMSFLRIEGQFQFSKDGDLEDKKRAH